MKKSTNIFAKAAILAVAVLPMLTSCYDDKSIWDKFDEIEDRLESLELSLNEQFQALNTLIEGKTTVTSCDKNADGSYKVTLSNGAKFTVLPDGTDYSALVSVITVNGVKCWATYDANGKLVALTDDAGQPVPVVTETKTQVEVVVEDGVYYLVVDGKKYVTGYDTEDLVQVFSSCTPLTDASGNVYAMTFTFGDGVKVTVAVDGYHGVIFRLPNILSSEVVTEYFVCNGDTQSLLLDMAGVVDYIMQIPDGWRVKERVDEYTEDKYIDITAPSVEAIEAGAAVADGELKVVAVVEGGKAAVSKVALSSTPFKVFEVNGVKAIVEPYTGVQKFVYGVTKKSEYNEQTILTTVESLLKSSNSLPAGYGMSEIAIDAEHADTYGKTLENNAEYVFWAIPALYREGDNAGFYVKEGTFVKKEFSNVTVKFGKTTASLLDAEINVTFNGVDKIYAGTVKKTSDALTEIVRLVNNNAYTPVAAPASYSGPASTFPSSGSNSGVEFIFATEYISWVIPYEEGKTTYTVNDLIYTTFKTSNITAGSSLKVTFGEVKATQTSISVPVSSEGAEMLFYAYMTKSDSDRIASLDNETKVEFIMDRTDCIKYKGNATTAVIEKLTPNSEMSLYAVAVDKNGKYGEVNQVSAKTGTLEYNSLTVTVSELEVTSDDATFKIEVAGGEATDFVYWFGKSSDDFWLNVRYLGGNQTTGGQYLALYPQDENIVKVMSKYGKVGSDGTLKVTGLAKTTDYIILVAAKDASGKYSKAGYKMVKTLAANLGTIVRTNSTEWNAAKSSITIDWQQDQFKKGSSQMFSAYGFNFSCPTNMTAYVICGSKEYYEDPAFFKTKEDMIIDIEKYAGRRYDQSIVAHDSNGELLSEPDWIDDNGKVHGGTLMNPCTFYVHGVPSRGFVTYFGSAHDSGNCPAWEEGACANYNRALTMIEQRCSLEWWMENFKNNKGVTNEEYQRQNAQAYLEAYAPYYEGTKPSLYVNNGEPIAISTKEATGVDQSGKVVDDVVVVLVDANGNYYEPMYFEVPNYFK